MTLVNNNFGVSDLGGRIMFPLNKVRCVPGPGNRVG